MKYIVPAIVGIAIWSCQGVAAPEESPFHALQVIAAIPAGATPASYLSAVPASDLDNAITGIVATAESSLDVSFQHLTSYQISEQLILKAEQGVSINLVGDADSAEEEGFLQIASEDQAGPRADFIRLTLGNTGGDMTSNFIVRDNKEVLFSSLAPDVNTIAASFGIGVQIRSHDASGNLDIARDFQQEHNQLLGGVFGDLRRRYGDLAKSDPNSDYEYTIGDVTLRVFFGPQERLVKQVIDEVYSARSSISIVTPLISSLDFANALLQKASFGVPVSILLENTRWQEISSLVEYMESIASTTPGIAPQNFALLPDRDEYQLGCTIVHLDRTDELEMLVDGRMIPVLSERIMILSHSLMQDDSVHDGLMLVFDRHGRAEVPAVFASLHSFIDTVFANHQ